MSIISLRQVGRISAGALSLLTLAAACAEGTNGDDVPIGGVAGDTATGGSGGSSGSASGGSSVSPMAGTSSVPTAGKGGVSGSGGTTSMAGQGGAGAMGGKAGSGGGGAGGTPGGGGAGGKAGGGAGGKAGGGAGGTGGAAGMAGSSGSGGSGGGAATGHRYAKLVATSEQGGNVWSSVAELQIMTTGSVAISRAAWTIMADSEETDDQMAAATAAIDGDNATFWHTSWEPPPADVDDAELPHSLIVDMTTARTITGFSYLPRQNNPNGRIKDWAFYLSKDGTTWGTAVKTGSFPSGTALQTITF